MTGKAHVSLGAAVGVTIGFLTIKEKDVLLTGGCIIASMAGSLFPDLDAKRSKISSNFPIVSFFTRIFFGHRGILHTPFFIVLFCGAYLLTLHSFVDLNIFVCFLVGNLCHLLQDSFTRRGIMWCYPISKKYHRFFILRSGKSNFMEMTISSGLYIVFLFLLLSLENILRIFN